MKSEPGKRSSFKINDKVSWKWLGRAIDGKVISIHLQPFTKVIKGKTIKRNGSAENPAYLVESDAGNLALKLQTELFKTEKKGALEKKATPKMFKS